jgi:DNA-binding transcriptional MerR regulator
VLLSIKEVAERWGVSTPTVRAIPASRLPYKNIGTGLQRERRRYHPDDVYAYENDHRKAS